MPAYRAPVRDMQFVIAELARLEDLTTLPGYEEITPDLAETVRKVCRRGAGAIEQAR